MSKKARSSLGRGLSALITSPDAEIVEDKINTIPNTLPLTKIVTNPQQPRKIFSNQELEELIESIKIYGVLQPILVRPLGDFFEIVAGERRFRAAERLDLKEVPVQIKNFSDADSFKIALVENLQRDELKPLEEAQGYQDLIEVYHLSQEEVAQAVGKSRVTVANMLRLLRLPKSVQELINSSLISTGHAKVILSIKEGSAQEKLANRVVIEGLSVRQLEELVSRAKVLESGETLPAGKQFVSFVANNDDSLNQKGVSDDTNEVVSELRNVLGTKVRITHNGRGRGSIHIDFFSESELQGILEKIVRA
jgi:ParB family chromosome partitioning protein